MVEKLPRQDAAKPKSIDDLRLVDAAKMLSDRIALDRLLRNGEYKGIGNRIATFITAFQKSRGSDSLDDESAREVKNGVERILSMPACKPAERPFVLKEIRSRLEHRGIDASFLDTLVSDE